MIRFIHTADIHFGVENYGKIDQKTGLHTRLLDFHHALQECITHAITHNVDFFLFCGDAYKTATPTPTQQKLLLSSFLRLHKAHIPTIIIIGNHDHPNSFGKAHALDIMSDLPLNGFYVINKPALITIPTKNGPITIIGIPWPTKTAYTLTHQNDQHHTIQEHLVEAIGAIIKSFTNEIDTSIPSILAGHLSVSSGTFSGSERRATYGQDPLFLPSQLAQEPLSYVALGHLHKHQIINTASTIPIVYAGSLERIDFGERNDQKGFCDVTIIDKKAHVTFVPVNTRKFIQIETKLAEHTENQTEAIIQEIQKNNITNAIVKIIYHLPAGQKDRVETKKIQEACSCAHYIAGIHAVKALEQRERRTQAKLDMSMETLLFEYFKQKNITAEKSTHLIQHIINLKHESSSET